MTAAQGLVVGKIKELITFSDMSQNSGDAEMISSLHKMASWLVKPLHMKNIYKLSVSALLLPGYSSMSFLFPRRGADITITIKPSFFGMLAYVKYTEKRYVKEGIFGLEDSKAFESFRNDVLRRAGVD